MTKENLFKIVDAAGGFENIEDISNCMTRLRLSVFDGGKSDDSAIKKIPGVLGLVHDKPTYLEVVLGPGVCRKAADTLNEIKGKSRMVSDKGWQKNKESFKSGQKKSRVKSLMKDFGSIFVPLIPGIIIAGICSAMVSLIGQVAPNYAEIAGLNVLYNLLNLVSQAFLTYLTAWTGYRAAEFFGGTPIIGGMLGMITSLAGIDEIAKLIGLYNVDAPLDSVLRMGRGGVLAVVISVFLMCKLEKAIRKKMPDNLDIMFTPMISLLVMTVVHVFVMMPILGFVSTGICNGLTFICMSEYPIVRMLAGFLSAALFLPMVAFGLHHGLVAFYSVQLETIGFITLYPALAMAGFGQVGAAIVLYIRAKKQKNRRLKAVISGALPAGALGVGEPLIYGVTLPLGKPFLTAGLGAGFGGAFVMLMQVASTAWGPSGLLGVFVMTAGPNGAIASVVNYLIGLGIAAVMGGFFTWLLTKDDLVKNEEAEGEEIDGENSESETLKKDAANDGNITPEHLVSPVKGKIVPLEEVPDETFSSGILGPGFGVAPEDETVYAPCDATVVSVCETRHAICLHSKAGADLLIHCGIDTVKMNGKGFDVVVKEGDVVTKGTKLMTFSRKEIKEAGYSDMVMMTVTNADDLPDGAFVFN